jgi:hypothetical protein
MVTFSGFGPLGFLLFILSMITGYQFLPRCTSIAQQNFVTGFGAPAQSIKQLNNCRSWATICINQVFIYAQLH